MHEPNGVCCDLWFTINGYIVILIDESGQSFDDSIILSGRLLASYKIAMTSDLANNLLLIFPYLITDRYYCLCDHDLDH